MRRSFCSRLAAAALAAWFAVLIVHPEWMHTMTMGGMHRGAPGRVAPGGAMAGMGGHDSSPTRKDESNECARHDCCCTTTVVLVPRGADLALVPVRIVRSEAAAPPARVAPAMRPHVIPFAIGPPETPAG